MVDITSEVNADYYKRVGELICRLAERADLVKVGKEPSIIADDMLTIVATSMIKGKAFSVRESFTRNLIMEVSDIRVVADAIVKKLAGAK